MTLVRVSFYPRDVSSQSLSLTLVRHPDIIQGTRPMDYEPDLGLPKRRNPDALPPRNAVEWVMSRIHIATLSLWSGNSLFAIKAGFISCMLA